MPLATECIYLGRVIGIEQAVAVKSAWRRGQKKPQFFCVECEELVGPHQSRKGHTPHFEHRRRNPACSRSNRKRVKQAKHEHFSIEDKRAIEGYKFDRQIWLYGRNAEIAEQRKRLDDYRCSACGFRLQVEGLFVVECHHLKPVSQSGVREVSIKELVSLCPTCHRIAHTRSEPYSVAEIKRLLKSAA